MRRGVQLDGVGNDVAVFKVGADGLPTPTGTSVKVGKPVCVKFLAKE